MGKKHSLEVGNRPAAYILKYKKKKKGQEGQRVKRASAVFLHHRH
jgi:hypothetical protein